jgi:hypothetical protein
MRLVLLPLERAAPLRSTHKQPIVDHVVVEFLFFSLDCVFSLSFLFTYHCLRLLVNKVFLILTKLVFVCSLSSFRSTETEYFQPSKSLQNSKIVVRV